MLNFFRKLFIKDYNNLTNFKVRQAHGKLASFIGVFSNLFLFVIKLIIGIISSSIAIIADSINNLSDMVSSVITLIGFKLSMMPADKEHPYGHQRIEYIAGFVVSIIILFVGGQLGYSSVLKIMDKENNSTKITLITIIILIISIMVKIWQAFFNKRIGKLINSVALIATAQDSLNDVIATTFILIGASITYFTGYNLDGYLGIAVSLFIIYSAIRLLKDTMNPLIGISIDSDFVQSIIKEIKNYSCVLGLHDIQCHSYGPTKCFMTIHVEVSSCQNLLDVHDEIDNIERKIYKKFGVELTIHIDPVEDKNEEVMELRNFIILKMNEINKELSLHDFRVVKGKTHTNLIFDLVVSRKIKDSYEDITKKFEQAILELDGVYHLVIHYDNDYLEV